MKLLDFQIDKKIYNNEYFIIFALATFLFFVRIIAFYNDFPLWLLLVMYPVSIISILFVWTVFKFIHRHLDIKMPYHPKKMIYRVFAELLLGIAFGFFYINLIIYFNDVRRVIRAIAIG